MKMLKQRDCTWWDWQKILLLRDVIYWGYNVLKKCNTRRKDVYINVSNSIRLYPKVLWKWEFYFGKRCQEFCEKNELKNRYTHVRWQKQDIDAQKQDIESPKQDIEIPEAFSNKTKQHNQNLFLIFGYEKFFRTYGCYECAWDYSFSGIGTDKEDARVGYCLSNERQGQILV